MNIPLNEDKHNLYSNIDSMNLNCFELYKYLTENDEDIVKFRQQVKKIEIERNLSSVMNDTKWIKLQQGIETLPFPPAYNLKHIHINKGVFSYDDFEKEPHYFGDWSNYWEEGLPVFFAIEWLEIRPKHRKHQGRLIPDKIIDATKELLVLLNKLHIPFEHKNNCVIIYGYK